MPLWQVHVLLFLIELDCNSVDAWHTQWGPAGASVVAKWLLHITIGFCSTPKPLIPAEKLLRNRVGPLPVDV